MQRAITGNAGIVDQDGNWPKIALHLANAFLAGVEIANVKLVAGNTCALAKRPGGFIITAIVGGNLMARIFQRGGDGLANASGATGNDCDSTPGGSSSVVLSLSS